MENKEKRQIIIDTDPGHDDALAILLLEKSGLFDIKATTTVAGNSTVQDTTNNARYVLDLIKSQTPRKQTFIKFPRLPPAKHTVKFLSVAS